MGYLPVISPVKVESAMDTSLIDIRQWLLAAQNTDFFKRN
jgi:hypothetical protein